MGIKHVKHLEQQLAHVKCFPCDQTFRQERQLARDVNLGLRRLGRTGDRLYFHFFKLSSVTLGSNV